jgi:carbon-monoxide dehydrogenase medium subunit
VLLPRFALARPETLDEAVGLLVEHGEDAAVYAGGTELLLAMKHRVLRYACLVDVKRVAGLGGVRVSAAGDLVVGALATHRELERDPLVRTRLPAYAELSRHVGNVRVRAAGTLAGNLCFAEPHADPPTLLAALGARLTLVGPRGARESGVEDFVAGAYETTRAPDEILAAVTVPARPPREAVAYERFAHLERPTAAVAAALAADADGRVVTADVWVGAVGPRPHRARAVESRLRGLGAREASARIGALVREGTREGEVPVDADAHGAADYKRQLVRVLIERAVTRAAADLEARREP